MNLRTRSTPISPFASPPKPDAERNADRNVEQRQKLADDVWRFLTEFTTRGRPDGFRIFVSGKADTANTPSALAAARARSNTIDEPVVLASVEFSILFVGLSLRSAASVGKFGSYFNSKLSLSFPQLAPVDFMVTDKYKIDDSIVLIATKRLDELWDGLLRDLTEDLKGEEPEQSQSTFDVKDFLLRGDQRRVNLPELKENILHDPNMGHWDLHNPENWPKTNNLYGHLPLEEKLVARDPARDIQKHVPVAIDFGTSSTVVAIGGQGQSRLLRIGGKDLREAPRPGDFENPTCLEMLDYNAFMADWRAHPYKPYIQWAHVKCSHWARSELAHDASCKTIQSGITNLKTWAKGGTAQPPLPRRDQNACEFILQWPESISRNPQDNFARAPFNPLELYAYFLGLYINNQHSYGGRIYHEYYMSFPVKFDKATRMRIMDSFSRGLERSLPATLGLRNDWRGNTPFSIVEGASEPAAYAAGVLPAMGLEPTSDGVPFGVFDFGGGTTDFAIGLYRLPTAKEEQEHGWEQVLDMLDSSGNETLGGEHLLHHMAYAVVRSNMKKLLSTGTGLPFAMPPDAVPFPGSELLLENSLVARTNTTKLCEALRPLWEEGGLDTQGTDQISLTLFDRGEAEHAGITLDVNDDRLRELLRRRIALGVEEFFTTFRQAFKIFKILPKEFHILLAGNSCRSPLVTEAFENARQKIADDPHLSDVINIHAPLLYKETDPYAPTLKTGVALGLLRIVPGEGTGMVERSLARNDETPFRYTVGMFKQDALMPVLHRYDVYGKWRPLTRVRSDLVMLMGYTDSPLAAEGGIRRGQCREKRISWNDGAAGKIVLIRAVGPEVIELVLATPDSYIPDKNELRVLNLAE